MESSLKRDGREDGGGNGMNGKEKNHGGTERSAGEPVQAEEASGGWKWKKKYAVCANLEVMHDANALR